jgi:predicted phage baseplate assembly protein
VSGDATTQLQLRGRRAAVRASALNGIDSVEVQGRELVVWFLKNAPALTPANVRLEAPPGERRPAVLDVDSVDMTARVALARRGGRGRYRLALVATDDEGEPVHEPLAGLDQRFACASFAFDLAVADADTTPLATAPSEDIEISYRGRDYEGLRALMLERLGATLPAFPERHAPDVWIALIELLAAAGDDLSYYQDAVATEAYLHTARRRVSVRRHARLLDYTLHEGCNARAWVSLRVDRRVPLPLGAVRFVAGARAGDGRVLDASELAAAQLQQYTALPDREDPLAEHDERVIELREERNAMELWSWGEQDAQLDAGATAAVVVDKAPAEEHPLLRAGDVLVLEQTEADGSPARPALAQAVRLTAVSRLRDELLDDTPLLSLRWSRADALTFALPVRSGGQRCAHVLANVVLVAHGVLERAQTTIAREALAGNATLPGPVAHACAFPALRPLAAHQAAALRGLYGAWQQRLQAAARDARAGRPLPAELEAELRLQLGADVLSQAGLVAGADAVAQAAAITRLRVRAGRLLRQRRKRVGALAAQTGAGTPLDPRQLDELAADWGEPLTAALHDARALGPAAAACHQQPREAMPLARLHSLTKPDRTWTPVTDVLGWDGPQPVFVVEGDGRGGAALRVGAAREGEQLLAAYWLGSGVLGNVAAGAIDALAWVGTSADGVPTDAGGVAAAELRAAVSEVRNPLAAAGGVDPEDVDAACLAIPGSFRDEQLRAITAADYAALAGAVEGVSAAAAELHTIGPSTIVDVAVACAARDAGESVRERVREALTACRRTGHRLHVRAPRYRSLAVSLVATLSPRASRAALARELAALLSDGQLEDGTPALYSAERVGFGATIYASATLAAAQALSGVETVRLERFCFADEPAAALAATPARSLLELGTLELARLDRAALEPRDGYANVWLVGGR